MQCFFPQNMAHLTRTPLFILNAAYDSWQVITFLEMLFQPVYFYYHLLLPYIKRSIWFFCQILQSNFTRTRNAKVFAIWKTFYMHCIIMCGEKLTFTSKSEHTLNYCRQQWPKQNNSLQIIERQLKSLVLFLQVTFPVKIERTLPIFHHSWHEWISSLPNPSHVLFKGNLTWSPYSWLRQWAPSNHAMGLFPSFPWLKYIKR